jgi:hypothetical protein
MIYFLPWAALRRVVLVPFQFFPPMTGNTPRDGGMGSALRNDRSHGLFVRVVNGGEGPSQFGEARQGNAKGKSTPVREKRGKRMGDKGTGRWKKGLQRHSIKEVGRGSDFVEVPWAGCFFWRLLP